MDIFLQYMASPSFDQEDFIKWTKYFMGLLVFSPTTQDAHNLPIPSLLSFYFTFL